MTRSRKFVLALLTLVILAGLALLALAPPPAPNDVHVADAAVPDPGDKPLDVRIWYPARLDEEKVHGATKLPLVLISHGTGGSLAGHSDTAIALARAGSVVAAMNHTGDNYRDSSYVGKGKHLIGRSRHVSRVIDYMLKSWPQHGQIDAARIGLFGHSAGGFTALVVAGGQPDMTRGRERCRKRPDAWDCQYVRRQGLDLERAKAPPDGAWAHDARVKSIAIAAPAVGYAFEPDRLKGVAVPVQLWEAEHDDIVEDSPEIVRRLMPHDAVDHRVVPGAGHFSFLAPCNLGMRTTITVMGLFGTPAICDDPAGFDRAAFHHKLNASLIAYFGKTLPGKRQ